MALVTGVIATFDNGASSLEILVDDADIEPGFPPEEPLAGARVRAARIITSLTRGIWVRVVDSTRPNDLMVDVFGRGRVPDDLTVNFATGRRVNLAQLNVTVGTE